MIYQSIFLALLLGYSACVLSFELISNSSYLEAHPIVVQTFLQHEMDKSAMTRALRMRYVRGDASPSLELLWQKKLAKPLSQPILVGRPDFPFPDRWPWTVNRPLPPENAVNAEKYSDFSQKLTSRPSIVYQIDGNYHLHAFDLETGESRLDFDLAKIFTTPLIAKHLQTAIGIGTDVAPALMQADVFYDNQWHSLLVGIVGDKAQAVFCIDIGSSSSMSLKDASIKLVWKLEEEHASFSQPTLCRTLDNTWHLLLAQIRDSGDNRFSAGFKMLHFKTGLISQDIKFMSPSTDNKMANSGSATCKNPIQFSAMTAIDSKSRGYVDYLYVGDNCGTLWKFELQKNFSQLGFLKQSAIFKMKNNEVHGEILSQPKIVLHSEYGFLISFLARYSNSAQRYLVNIWDKAERQGEETYLFSALRRADSMDAIETENWYLPIKHEHAYPLVRNKQVIIALQANQLISKDMHSSKTCAEADYIPLLSQPTSQPSLAFVGAPLAFFQGVQQPNLFLQGLSDGSFAWTELDLNDRIGRRAWRELNY